MNINDIVLQWIKAGEKISFWGASESAFTIIQEFVKRYGTVNGDIYDSFPTKSMVSILDRNFQIKDGRLYDVEKTKLVLCITKRQSYYEVVKQIEKSGATYKSEYIDAFECLNIHIPGTNKKPYEKITPYATYAPWRKDNDFMWIYNKVKDNTLIDLYRLYSLWILCKESSKCSKGDIAEIGVWRGGSGTLLGYGMNKFCLKDSTKLYMFDTFSGVIKAGEEDVYYNGGEHCDTNLNIVQKILDECAIQNVEIVPGIFPDDSYEKFDLKLFRLVHIDVDVYKSAKEIFEYIWQRIVRGGIVIFDDYGFNTTVGVTRLCEELENKINDGRCIFQLNGQAIFIKL